MQTNLQSFYRPQDAPFSLEKSEHLALIGLNKTFNTYPECLESKAWLWGDTRMWITNEGKEFALKIRQKFPECIKEADEPHYLLPCKLDNPLLDYPLVQQAVGNQIVNKSPISYDIPVKNKKVDSEKKEEKLVEKDFEKALEEEKKQKSEGDEDEGLCIICMERNRNIAFNCGHVLLCNQCESQVQECPNCRISITTRIKLFL